MKNMHVQGPQINQFNNVAPKPIPRSAFIRDYPRRMPFDADYLIPLMLDEILPGDDINIRMNALVRLATPIKPVMENIYFETFWFFVPNRLVWENWEKFQGQQTNPGDSVAYTIPVLDHTKSPLSTTGFAVQSIYDYMNLPPLVTDIRNISSLFNRGMDLIWNEWFRDENLQNSLTINTGDSADDPAIYALRKRGNRKDYFRSCLPWPQKGNAVTIGIGGTAPLQVKSGGASNLDIITDGNTIQLNSSSGNLANWLVNGSGVFSPQTNPIGAGPHGVKFGSEVGAMLASSEITTNIEANLASATAITINALRQAALYQQILELDARAGTRYVESLYSRFGVISPDFRLQRPELIGQGSSKINVYAVPQTAPTDVGTTPQGNLAAFGTLGINGQHGCRYSATEHGMLIAFCSVRADLTYQQGLPKMFSRRTRLDFYEPLLNGLGEQAVLNKELYCQGGTTDDENVFGYQERFAEYRFRNAEIIGLFRSQVPNSLDVWHLSQEFGALPVLNSSFIEQNTPMDRIIAVNTEPDFIMDCQFNYRHVRPMPIRSNPGINIL